MQVCYDVWGPFNSRTMCGVDFKVHANWNEHNIALRLYPQIILNTVVLAARKPTIDQSRKMRVQFHLRPWPPEHRSSLRHEHSCNQFLGRKKPCQSIESERGGQIRPSARSQMLRSKMMKSMPRVSAQFLSFPSSSMPSFVTRSSVCRVAFPSPYAG